MSETLPRNRVIVNFPWSVCGGFRTSISTYRPLVILFPTCSSSFPFVGKYSWECERWDLSKYMEILFLLFSNEGKKFFTSPSSFYFIKKGSGEFPLFTLFCCLTNSLQLICSWLWFCLLFNSTVFADSRELSCSFEFDRIIYTIFIRYREMMEQS